MMTEREIAEGNTILRGVVGSTALGTSIKEHDDTDEMGICVEPPECVLGLNHFQHWIFRTKPEGVRSGPGDLDLAIYGLRKYFRLAAQGNPSILILLYLHQHHYRIVTAAGKQLIEHRDIFVSQEAGRRFLGYLRGQKAKLRGERSPCVARPELVERYGYDTKFAGHALRLGLQGIEYMKEHRLTLPMLQAPLIRNVRTGCYTLDQTLTMIDDVERHLSELVDACTLHVDLDKVNAFMIDTYTRHWRNISGEEGYDAHHAI